MRKTKSNINSKKMIFFFCSDKELQERKTSNDNSGFLLNGIVLSNDKELQENEKRKTGMNQ